MMANDYWAGQKDTRPWGDWEVLDAGDGYVIKRIRVLPGGQLSLQRHRHRSEHWVVASGRPIVTVGDTVVELRAGESVDIVIGALHRIVNHSDEIAVLIEMQRGALLREDDIERVEDIYGRAAG
jgi:mannose-6-phosphate isomerase-like protein (cupin superfamily)